MRVATVQIVTKLGPVECEGVIVADGLAVADWEGRDAPYTVTHIPSGHQVLGAEFRDRRLAVRCARELAGTFESWDLARWLVQGMLKGAVVYELEAVVERYKGLDKSVEDRAASGESWL